LNITLNTYAPYSATSAVKLTCDKAIQVDFGQAKGLTECHNDVTEEIWEGVAVFCRLHMHCYASGTLSGTNTIQLQFPDLFQNMKYSVSTSAWDTDKVAAPPNSLKSVFGPTTSVNDQEDTTAQATALTGTKSAPTTLNFGLVRSKFKNEHSGRNATSFGIQTSYKGLVKEENKLGTSDGVHYVAFVFDVEESVYLKQYADKVEFITRIATMFTLLLSAMSGMKFMKSHLELLIDKCCMRRPLTEVPDDVRRRYKILNETNLARRHSIAIGGGGGGSVPQRKRRLSSRELMKQEQEQSSGIELVIRNGDIDARVFDNPMKKSDGQMSLADGDALKTKMDALVQSNVELKNSNVELKNSNVALNNRLKSSTSDLRSSYTELQKEMVEMKRQMALLLAGSMPNSKRAAKPKTKNNKWKSAKNKLKSVTAFKQRRRSSLMTSSAEVDFVNTVHVDDETGREYSIDPTTGIAEWLVKEKEEEEEEEVHVDPETGQAYNSQGWL
jgi:hypothetical protein